MKLLNPSDAYWLQQSPVEAQIWIDRLQKTRESTIDCGDLDDARPYMVALIKPGREEQAEYAKDILKSALPVPAHLFLVAGKLFGLVVIEPPKETKKP